LANLKGEKSSLKKFSKWAGSISSSGTALVYYERGPGFNPQYLKKKLALDPDRFLAFFILFFSFMLMFLLFLTCVLLNNSLRILFTH
jgi:hypothetical protein